MTKKSKFANAMYAAVLLLAMTVLLAACGGGNGSSNNESGSAVASTPPVATEEPAGGEVTEEPKESEGASGADVSDSDKELFLKIAQESAQLTSYKVTMITDQEMEFNGENVASKTQIDMTAIMKPTFAFHQVTSMDSIAGKQTMESYMLEDGFYMQDPASGAWMKYPTEMSEQLAQAADSNPADMMDNLMEFADDLIIEEEGDNYVVTLKATAGDLGKLLGGADMTAAAMEIHSMEYRIVVDRGNYYPLSMDMKMDMTVGEGEFKSRIVSDTSMTYSDHNGIKEIQVPAEVLESTSLTDLAG